MELSKGNRERKYLQRRPSKQQRRLQTRYRLSDGLDVSLPLKGVMLNDRSEQWQTSSRCFSRTALGVNRDPKIRAPEVQGRY